MVVLISHHPFSSALRSPFFSFLVADTQLYKSLCPSVRRSVRRSVNTSRKVWKRAFPPLPTRPQLVLAVYPALLQWNWQNLLISYPPELSSLGVSTYEDAVLLAQNNAELFWSTVGSHRVKWKRPFTKGTWIDGGKRVIVVFVSIVGAFFVYVVKVPCVFAYVTNSVVDVIFYVAEVDRLL